MGQVFRNVDMYQLAYNNALSGYSYNGKTGADYARSALSYEDFVKNSGLQNRANAYNTAYASAPRYTVDQNGNRVTSNNYRISYDDNGNKQTYSTVVDMSGYADSVGGVLSKDLMSDQDALKKAYNQIRQQQGTMVYDADAGAVYAGGNTSGGSNSGDSGGRRQGGDQIVTDANRTDMRGNETLLGGRGGGKLQDKDTLF